MAHISSIGAGLFSDLSVCRETYSGTLPADQAAWKALFANELANGTAVTTANGEFTRILNIREFPAMGTPPNIVNVPVFGQKTSQQVQGQADSPSMELTLNYVGTSWQNAANYLGAFVGDGIQRAFRFTLLNSEPTGSTAATRYASTTGAETLGKVENSQYFWVGKIEAMVVNPQLTDANTATLTISIQSPVFGAYTTDAS